jgi:polysaccharide export outer membrane protein
MIIAKRGKTYKKFLGNVEKVGQEMSFKDTIYILLFLWSLTFFSGCVPAEKLAYLQYEDDIKGKNITDSLVRSYKLKKRTYNIEPGDILSIRVASVTPEEFDFISDYATRLGIVRSLGQYQQNISVAGGANNGNVNAGQNARLNVNAGGGNAVQGLLISNQNIGFTVDQNGNLELPEVGKFGLAGLTIPEAEEKIRQLLVGYYETPLVRIELLNFHFTVLGEVENEGRFTSFDPEITIFDAIALAGNIGEFADRSNVKIIRQQGEAAGVFYLNMLDERTMNADNFYVQRNDIIVVPALDARAAQRYAIPNVSRVLSWIGAVLGVAGLVVALTR